jgi:enamine deaminase RidA (YjgF/YER057c/UK114 family)
MTLERFASSSPWAPSIGFSAAVVADGWIITAGVTAVRHDGEVVGGDDAYEQTREALRKLLAILAEAGAGPEHVVQTRMYVVRAEDADAVGRAHGEVFSDHRPAATLVLVAGLLDPRMLVELEMRAFVGAS